MTCDSWITSSHRNQTARLPFRCRVRLARQRTARRTDRSRFERLEQRTLLATITVNSLEDTIEADGKVTLREALEAANTDSEVGDAVAGNGADTIHFMPALSGMIKLVRGELVIDSEVTIAGPGAGRLAVNGNNVSRVFHVLPGATTAISALKIAGGNATDAVAYGGGIFNQGRLTVEDADISGNSSSVGGGIEIEGPTTIRRTTISNNIAQFGGGVATFRDADTALLENVTISGNRSTANVGGGVWASAGTLQLVNSTIAFNRSDNFPGAGIYNSGSTVTISNSIISNNGTDATGPDKDISGSTIASMHYSIIGQSWTSLFGSFDPQSGNQFGVDPGLLPLTIYGGSTATHALPPSSPAVNAGSGALAIDQRGVARPQGAAPDIGSFELQPDQQFTFTVDSTETQDDGDYSIGDLSIREAVGLANGRPGHDIIDFAPAVHGKTLFVVGGHLDIRDDLTIRGPGADLVTLDGNSQNRLVLIQAGTTAEIVGVALQRGTANFEPGGGIWNKGKLTLRDLALRNNVVIANAQTGVGGGGIYNGQNAVLILSNTVVSGNITQDFFGGGGIYNSLGTVTIADHSVISGNQSNFDAGGVRNFGTLTISDSIVENNVAIRNGGGVFSRSGTVRIERSRIQSNRASQGGGIVNDEFSTMTIVESTIRGNAAIGSTDAWGGGVYDFKGTLNVVRSTLSGNASEHSGGAIMNNAGIVRIENSTLSGNGELAIGSSIVRTDAGGAIYNFSGGSLDVVNATITVNKATSIAGGIRSLNSSLALGNTIIAGNTCPSVGCGPDTNRSGTGTITDLGHNLFGAVVGLGSLVGVHNNLIGIEARLDPVLRDNGGHTMTHLLLPDSPAIDAGNDALTPFLDQRGQPISDVDNTRTVGPDVGTVDIGAYELQQFVASDWQSEVNDASQFGDGQALVFGFGFDDGDPNSSVLKNPEFLGFQFDTGPIRLGAIADGPLGSRWGGELRADFSGKLGFDLGFYVNSGSVDVNYDGTVNYIIDEAGGWTDIRSIFHVADGSMYTISPKIGAYADLVLELDAKIGATGCVWSCAATNPDPHLHVDEKFELFSINRQERDGDDIDGDGDRDEPLFIDAAGNETPNPTGATPLFDGDIRFAFDQLASDIVDGVKENVRNARPGRQLQKADEEQRRGEIEIEEGRRELEKARTDAERRAAQDKILKGGNKLSNADARRANAISKMTKRSLGGTPKAGLGLSFGEAPGSLLGLEATLSAGIGVDGVASAGKELGTFSVTLPDVNLKDAIVANGGQLHASTADFPDGSALDAKRQLAQISLDIGGMLGPLLGLPTGTYTADLGPLGLRVQTASYNIVPTLNVTQDVQVTPYAKQLQFQFDRAVVVEVNGIATATPVSSVAFSPGDRVRVKTDNQPVQITPTLKVANRFSNDIGLEVDLSGAFEAFSLGLSVFGQSVIDIGPLLTHEHRFGTVPLGNVFEQTFDLIAFKQDVEGNLIDSVGRRIFDDAGSKIAGTGNAVPLKDSDGEGLVFNQALSPFTVGLAGNGDSPATSLQANPTATVPVTKDVPRYFSTTLVEPLGSAGTSFDVFRQVDYQIDQNTAVALIVFQDGLTLALSDGSAVPLQRTVRQNLPSGTTRFTLKGFSDSTLADSAQATIGVTFGNTGTAQVTATRGHQTQVTMDLTATQNQNQGQIADEVVDSVGAAAILSTDVDGDGSSSPLTDGIVLLRYLNGVRGAALVAGAVNPAGTRTDPDDVAHYIERALDMAIVDPATGRSSLSLDIDGDGVSLAGGDGVLLARHLAGFTGDSLVAGAVNPLGGRTVASAIEQFLSFGRVTVNNDAVTLLDGNGSPKNVQGAGFGGAELSNTDRFGVARALDPGPNATEGSAPTTPAHSNFAPPGATASSAARATFVQTATALPSFTYDLTTFGQTVTYESFYLDAIQPNNLVSRVPQATPMDISSSPTLLGLLVNLDQNQINGIESRIIQGPAEHKRLGSDEPIFIEVPDAAGYEYQAATGFRFQTVHFDTDVGGNMYLGNEFDLYLNDGTAWVYAATIAAQDGIDFAAIGYANGVDRFQLFGTALPDASLHRAANDAAPGTRQLDDGTIVYELPTTVGFTLAGPDLVPTVQLTQLRPRLRATTPVDVQVCKINCGFAFGQNAEFLIVRNSLNAAVVDVAYRFTDQPGDPYKQLEPIELTSATGITVLGDAHEDVVLFDHTRGPIRLPITFHGGSGTNLLGQQNQDVLRVRGRNVTIDLTGRDEITGVERVDIRGEGPNKLKLDLAAVKRNRDTANTLMVLASSDDAVDIGSGWIKDAAQVTIDGIPFDSYRQGGTTVLLSDPTASAAAQIQAEALPQFSAPPVVQPLSQATASAQARTSLGSGEEPVPKAVQRITASPAVLQVAPGRTLNVDILYSALGNVGTTGLHLQMFFDSSKVDLATVRNQLGESLSAVQIRDDGPCTAAGDCLGRDGNPATDKYLNIMWLDADGDWLAGAVAPVRLYTAEFTAANDFDGTTIGFAGNPAQGFALDAVSLAVSARVDSAPEPPQVTDVAFVTAGSGRKSTINAIRVTFSEPMSLVAVENLANYAFRFAERNNRVIPLSSATFDPNSLTVALNLAQPLKPKGSYDLVINALNVTDLAGNPLDGDSDGLPGGDYISLIVLGSSLSYIEPDGDLVELHSTELMQLNNESGGQLKLLADHATLTGSVQTPRKGAGDGFALLNSVDPKFDNRLPNSFLIGAGQIEFRSANYSGPEHSGDVVVTVVRTGGRAGSVSVDYATSDNTAAASLDYTPVAGTLRFTHGESSKTFIVPILDDILQDFDETIDLTLSNPSSDVALGPQSTATLTIRDDEDSNADFDGPTVLDYEVILDSRSRVTTVRLSFDEPLDRTAAEDDTNFSLVLVGRVPQAIAFYPASYDNLTQAVQLDLVKPLRVKPSKPLQVIVDDLLTDASGNRLDGNNDGRPGGDYLLYFGQR